MKYCLIGRGPGKPCKTLTRRRMTHPKFRIHCQIKRKPSVWIQVQLHPTILLQILGSPRYSHAFGSKKMDSLNCETATCDRSLTKNSSLMSLRISCLSTDNPRGTFTKRVDRETTYLSTPVSRSMIRAKQNNFLGYYPYVTRPYKNSLLQCIQGATL